MESFSISPLSGSFLLYSSLALGVVFLLNVVVLIPFQVLATPKTAGHWSHKKASFSRTSSIVAERVVLYLLLSLLKPVILALQNFIE